MNLPTRETHGTPKPFLIPVRMFGNQQCQLRPLHGTLRDGLAANLVPCRFQEFLGEGWTIRRIGAGHGTRPLPGLAAISLPRSGSYHAMLRNRDIICETDHLAIPHTTKATMEQSEFVDQTANFVRDTLAGESSGHDWWHVYRVWRMARQIALAEKADLLVVELAALLHDIADWKAHDGDVAAGPTKAMTWLRELDVDTETAEHVCQIVRHISFKGAGTDEPELSLEGQVVQDADRLDAMGAIGIARAFSYGGAKGRVIHDPNIDPETHSNATDYLKSQGPSINHFYEKLLLLKDRMNTRVGRMLAQKRHLVMEEYLERFFAEWEESAHDIPRP